MVHHAPHTTFTALLALPIDAEEGRASRARGQPVGTDGCIGPPGTHVDARVRALASLLFASAGWRGRDNCFERLARIGHCVRAFYSLRSSSQFIGHLERRSSGAVRGSRASRNLGPRGVCVERCACRVVAVLDRGGRRWVSDRYVWFETVAMGAGGLYRGPG